MAHLAELGKNQEVRQCAALIKTVADEHYADVHMDANIGMIYDLISMTEEIAVARAFAVQGNTQNP